MHIERLPFLSDNGCCSTPLGLLGGTGFFTTGFTCGYFVEALWASLGCIKLVDGVLTTERSVAIAIAHRPTPTGVFLNVAKILNGFK